MVEDGGVGARREPRRHRLFALVEWLAATITAEGERRVLWLPVFFGGGIASYFTLTADGRTSENAVWSYEQPFPAVHAIAEHLAFYPDRVDAIEVG